MVKEIIEMQSESIFTWNAQGLPQRLGIHKTKANKPSVEREYAVLIEKYRPRLYLHLLGVRLELFSPLR